MNSSTPRAQTVAKGYRVLARIQSPQGFVGGIFYHLWFLGTALNALIFKLFSQRAAGNPKRG
jgi:hypothetical protein